MPFKHLLLALAFPAAVAAQFSHPLAVSRGDLPQTPRALGAFPDTVHVLALMVQFQTDNDDRTTGNGTFDLSNPASPALDAPPHDRQYVLDHLQFLSNYYRRVSKGRLVVATTLVDSAVTLPGTIASYSPVSGGSNLPVGNLVRDAWVAADSLGRVRNFSSYDCFLVIHAGAGRDIDLVNAIGYDPTPFDIPSLYVGLGSLRSFFGTGYEGIPVQGGAFHITNSIVVPETESRTIPGVSGNVQLVFGINGLLCSSFGSFLGLPDLFDTKTGASGIGRFGLMDGQSIFSFSGAFPPEPSAWEKAWLGWVTPIVVPPGSHTVTLPAVALEDSIYRVPISNAEYFLLENRNRDPHASGITITSSYRGVTTERTFARDTAGLNAFDISILSGDVVDVSNPDWSLPGGVATDGTFYDGGTLVWHIDESVILPNLADDAVNADPDHRGVNLLEADGSQDIGQQYDLLSPGSGSESGTEFDFWYQGNTSPAYANELSSATHPSSETNNGSASHIAINTFSARGPRMSATIIRGDQVAPVAGYPIAVDGDVARQQVSIVDAGAGTGPVALLATDGVPIPRETTSGQVVPTAQVRGALYAFRVADGKNIAGFRSDGIIAFASAVGEGYTAPPAAADLNGDGVADLVVAQQAPSNPQGSMLQAYMLRDADHDSLADLYFSTAIPRPITAGPAISDSLIAVGTTGGMVYFLRLNGTIIDSLAALPNRTATVAGVSLAGNGNAFVITGSDGTVRLSVRTAAGNAEQEDSVWSVGKPIVGPAVTSQWNGATCEVVATTDGGVFFSGPAATGFPVFTGTAITEPPAVADIDGDGSRDIVVFSGNMIFAYNERGVLLDHFPVTVHSADPLVSAPVIADLNGDGHVDIVGITGDGKTVAYDRDGRSPAGFPILVGVGGQSAAIAVLSDSVILLSSSSDGSVSGWLTGKTSGASAAAAFPWAQYQHDARRSGADFTPMTVQAAAGDFMPKSRAYNWPNPVYNGNTFIRYYLTDNATVSVKIFDLAGDLVTELHGPGVGGLDNEIPWNVSGVQSGVYFARIQADGNGKSAVAIIKVAVVK